jgi:hypothetical protein
VHARNLVNFLANKDDGNFKAHEFVQGFKARTGEIDGHMQKLNQQVFHLAKGRPRDAVGKFNSGHAKPVHEWVEANFADFLKKLSPEQRAFLNDRKADPALDEASYISISLGPTDPGSPISTRPLSLRPLSL